MNSKNEGITPVITVDSLNAGFRGEPDVKILHDVSLAVQKGKTLAVVGESGSGKSVTSMHVMQLLDKKTAFIQSGTIQFNGQDIPQLTDDDLEKIRGQQIAMIFQEPMTALNSIMRCGKQVVEMIQWHEQVTAKEAKERVISLFTKVKLPDPERAFQSFPHELSGGQKQRVVIAMAISCNPSVLIADEPTTALDVSVQKSILDLLKSLQKEGDLALIFITHDLGVVAEIADEICVMRRGEVVEFGDAQKILKNPQHLYTQGLLACRPPLNQRPLRLPTVEQIVSGAGQNTPYENPKQRKLRQENIQSKNPLLEVKELSKTYASKRSAPVHAVDAVSFKVYPGETFGLVGESGCGKTTLSRMILNLIKPSSGEVLFEGKRIDTLSRREMKAIRSRLQIVFQDPYSALNPSQTIGNAITEAMQIHQPEKRKEERKNLSLELLKKVGLDDSAFSKYPHEFSGGQRQRIVIARALAVNPSIIICDESVSALDVSVQAQVLNLLNDLKEEYGLTLIFISHDLSVVKYMSDRIMVMNQGKVEEIQEADRLFHFPSSPYTDKLIQSIPGISSLSRLKG